MDWIKQYQLFLFDFDGLLVNTEHLHYQAYQIMCQRLGFKLPWDFPRYCLAAHFDGTGLRDQIYAEFPALQKAYPDWAIPYQKKKATYLELLQSGAVNLMPGISELLKALEKAHIKRCVVTHSPVEQIRIIRQQNPQLNSIPHWLTREDYSKPKPDPECYFKAIQTLANKGDAIIGFEDTPRGLSALQQVPAQAVLVTTITYPNMPALLLGNTAHYTSMLKINETLNP